MFIQHRLHCTSPLRLRRKWAQPSSADRWHPLILLFCNTKKKIQVGLVAEEPPCGTADDQRLLYSFDLDHKTRDTLPIVGDSELERRRVGGRGDRSTSERLGHCSFSRSPVTRPKVHFRSHRNSIQIVIQRCSKVVDYCEFGAVPRGDSNLMLERFTITPPLPQPPTVHAVSAICSTLQFANVGSE